jgi:hypothetical protein
MKNKNTLNDLREHLFATLTALRDPDAPMELERAKAVSEVAQTIINTAKVEIDYMRVTGSEASTAFLQLEGSEKTQTGLKKVEIDDAGLRTVTHRIR